MIRSILFALFIQLFLAVSTCDAHLRGDNTGKESYDTATQSSENHNGRSSLASLPPKSELPGTTRPSLSFILSLLPGGSPVGETRDTTLNDGFPFDTRMVVSPVSSAPFPPGMPIVAIAGPPLKRSDTPSPSYYKVFSSSDEPSDAPSDMPSNAPSDIPSLSPSDVPSLSPSITPSGGQTFLLTSDAPSSAPSSSPSCAQRSDLPSSAPTTIPTPTDTFILYSDAPSSAPTTYPSYQVRSSDAPSASPSWFVYPKGGTLGTIPPALQPSMFNQFTEAPTVGVPSVKPSQDLSSPVP